MGTVVSLADYRRRRAPGGPPLPPAGAARRPVTFFFDLGDPLTYLAAERVERSFAAVAWQPVLREVMPIAPAAPAAVEARAATLRLPLVWPEYSGPWDAVVRPALRVAALAVERGRGAAFVLAAGRLAYGGGYALDHAETLAEAAEAAGLEVDDALAAARDDGRDRALEDAAGRLVRLGVDRLPVIAVGARLFCGEDRIGEALLAARAGLPATRAG